MFLRRVDKLTAPNTIFFYLSLLSTPGWMVVAALPVYNAAVAWPIAGALLLVVGTMGWVSYEQAADLNAEAMDTMDFVANVGRQLNKESK